MRKNEITTAKANANLAASRGARLTEIKKMLARAGYKQGAIKEQLEACIKDAAKT